MHVYAIVGFLDAFDDSQLMLLDTEGKGFSRLKKISAHEFLLNLKAKSVVDLVRLVNQIDFTMRTLGVLKLREAIKKDGGRVAHEKNFNEWKYYSLIGFTKKEELSDDKKPKGFFNFK